MFIPLLKILILISGILTIITGVIHISTTAVKPWCTNPPSVVTPDGETVVIESGDHSCVGPALLWNKGSTSFTSDSNKNGWRTFMTTDINVLLDTYTPIILGSIIIASGSTSCRQSIWPVKLIAYSWGKMAVYLVVMALFGNFG